MTPTVVPDLTPAPRSASPLWISFTVTALANSKSRLGISGGWPRIRKTCRRGDAEARGGDVRSEEINVPWCRFGRAPFDLLVEA
jgi:hypothetical protein